MAFAVTLSPVQPTILAIEKIKFTATVTGENGAVTYKWYVDDAEQAGQTASTFVFDPASKIASFEVKVEATDESPETVDDTEVVTALSQASLLGDVKTKLDTLHTDLAKIVKATGQ